MREEPGDLWEYPAQYRCVTTNAVVQNGRLIMGAGVALEAKRRFPGLPTTLGAWVTEYGNIPFLLKEEGLITFPTKRHWRDNSNIVLIYESARKVVELVEKFAIQSVVMPRPGCGNGGLTWEFVKPFIADILDDRFVVVYRN